MTTNQFLKLLDKDDRNIISQLREIIIKADDSVKETVSSIMSIENALVYTQEGVFKYGLAKTKDHFTFHSMVMYGNEKLKSGFSTQLKGAKIQKGCINFKNLEQFPLEAFRKHLEASAQTDFCGVIAHYKNKQK
jgi:hypothetical protein